MKKLLHERLRNRVADCRKGIENGKKLRNLTDSGRVDILEEWADEIERYYIPRPRFEDGEPVQFGDEVEGCDGRADAILIFEDGSGVIYGSNDYHMLEEYGGADIGEDGLKRPSPKAIDHDSLEKIRLDALAITADDVDRHDKWMDIADRLSALIEKEK